MKTSGCASPASDELAGEVLASRYRVLKRIGEGGMGVVHRAWDHVAEGYVVVKSPHRAMLADERSVARFEREMEAMRRTRHGSVVPVIDFGSVRGFPYAVMPYLAGGSLARRRPVRGGRPAAAASATLRHWLEQIAAALDQVHAAGFVHRDVKPDNILFDGRGEPHLGDFGIATFVRRADLAGGVPGFGAVGQGLTAAGHAIGTPEYMAPELIAGHAVDGRADQYALAVVVYEWLAGQPPFRGATAAETLGAHVAAAPPRLAAARPELPESLTAAVERGLAKQSGDRFPSCREFAEFALLHVPLESPPAPRLICPSCGVMMTPAETQAGVNGRCPGCREVLFVTEDLQAVVSPADRLLAASSAGGAS
ncbi:MAG: protein kinase domain-containing protein [Planctomycetota bacterium]